MSSDTIVAIATANGVGSISIVRLSGNKALEIAQKITKKKSIKARFAHLCKLYNSDDDIVDEAVIIYFKAPFSYSGEDVIEFQCHGGEIVASLIIEECVNLGARLARAGEFTKRAFLNGKIDLSKAEAIASLIDAKSKSSALALAKHLKGDLKDFVDDAREIFLNIISYVEVSIDYAEEDLPESVFEDIETKLKSLKEKLTLLLESSKRREGLFSGFKVSIIGKPNVGKSSILNRLLNFERAIVSDIAGTTRDTIEESIKIGSHLIKIVDTAGIRENSSDSIEQIGIERSIKSVEDSEIVIAIFDLSREFDEEDRKILNLIKEHRDAKDIIVLFNKSDLKEQFDTSLIQEFLTIKTDKSDIKDLAIKLESILNRYDIATDEIVLTSKRQIESVSKTLIAIDDSFKSLYSNELEIFSFELSNAISYISEITKPIDYSEILDKMFSNFCLGK